MDVIVKIRYMYLVRYVGVRILAVSVPPIGKSSVIRFARESRIERDGGGAVLSIGILCMTEYRTPPGTIDTCINSTVQLIHS